MTIDLTLYNTRTRAVEKFVPLSETVTVYSCGPTVYNYAHIGNHRSFIFADILKRVLAYKGFEVKDVMNITDVGHLVSDADEGEDKMLKGARREGKTVWDIASFYTNAFMKDVEKLNMLVPESMPKATDHIQDMIDMITTLEEKGFTYTAGGNVYFDTSKFTSYTELAKLPPEEDMQARVEEDSNKKNRRDFVLWFTKSKFDDQEMKWDSPWGTGYPGWHIECSAMSHALLGEHIDIHTGGTDHIPVHHTNEIAQSECCFGNHPWVNFWMHSAFLKVDGGKMAKSEGNFLTVQTLEEKGYDPLHYRYFCMTAHYRMVLNFTFEALDSAKNAFEKLKKKVLSYRTSDDDSGDALLYFGKFEKAISDDINMPQALAVMWEVIDSDMGDKKKLEVLLRFDDVLGLGMNDFEETVVDVPEEIMKKVQEREDARAQKDFTRADTLRDEIAALGYVVEDSDTGPRVLKG